VAAVTAEQVSLARDEGYRAGFALAPSSSNPYAAEHVPEWEGPRTAAERAAAERDEQRARILASVWLRGHREGRGAYAQGKGLQLPSELV
jgi:N-acyl-D-aspartate/D-glutamate deacylase